MNVRVIAYGPAPVLVHRALERERALFRWAGQQADAREGVEAFPRAQARALAGVEACSSGPATPPA